MISVVTHGPRHFYYHPHSVRCELMKILVDLCVSMP